MTGSNSIRQVCLDGYHGIKIVFDLNFNDAHSLALQTLTRNSINPEVLRSRPNKFSMRLLIGQGAKESEVWQGAWRGPPHQEVHKKLFMLSEISASHDRQLLQELEALVLITIKAEKCGSDREGLKGWERLFLLCLTLDFHVKSLDPILFWLCLVKAHHYAINRLT